MRKFRLFGFGIVCFLAFGASPALAQAKLGYVQGQLVLEKSAEGKKIMAQLRESDQKNQALLARLDEDIRQLQTKLSTQRLTLTDTAATQYTSDLDRKNTDRKRQAEDAYTSWTQMRDRLFSGLQSELSSIINQLGKEKGFDLIFELEKSGAVYWNPALDLTDEVIRRYDATKTPTK